MSEEVENSLLHCPKKSCALSAQCVEERFVSHSGKDIKLLWSCYQKQGEDNAKSKTTVRCKTKDIPMNGEEMYLRLLAINKAANHVVCLIRFTDFTNQ